MPEWGGYEFLRPAQIEAIRAENPIAYIPWGALEWHSYHNPVGLDGLKARGLCEALAKQTGGIVLPPVYAGTDTIKPFKGFKHTLEHKAETVIALCTEYLEQLADEDFKILIIVTGHYGRAHVEAIKSAADTFADAHPDLKVWALADWEPHEGHFEGNHAAKGETSYLMLFHPETVDISMLPDDRVTTLDEDGVMGTDPRESSAAFGQQQLDVFVDEVVKTVNSWRS